MYNAPHHVEQKFVRLRNDGLRTTLAYKKSGTKLHEQKELEVIVSDWDTTNQLLLALGCTHVSYEETKRELWKLAGAEITIDSWPFLEPLLEIEASNETELLSTIETLGLDTSKALFGTVDLLYAKKYNGRTILELKNRGGELFTLTFEGKNPFI